MSFDADSYLQALQKPTVTINGRTYHGRLLSYAEWLPYEDKLRTLATDNADPRELMAVYRKLLRDVFPSQLSYRWLGDPVTLLLQSPALLPFLKDFFVLQGNALNPSPTLPVTPTQSIGTTSNDSP